MTADGRAPGALFMVVLFVGATGAGCGQSSGSANTDGGGGDGGSRPATGNQIVNGDFSDGQTDWGVESGSTFVTASIVNGQLCVMSPAGVAVTTIWPGGTSPVASLVPGVTYLLSYQVSSNVPLSTFEVQIGPVGSLRAGIETDLDVTTDVPGTTIQTLSHSLSVTAADAQAGLAFKFSYGIYSGLATVCLDNVSLTSN